MVALKWPPFVALFACSWIVVLCQETQEVKVKPGEDATLPCRGHRGADIEVIKWIRTDLKPDEYVFFFRDGSSDENYQHESYRGRVELRDPEMKNGDASVILKNVNINDAGTYECRVREEKEKGQAKLISTVMLTVTEPGHTAGHKEGGDKEGGDKEGGNKEEGDEEGNVGLKVGLPVGVILLFLGVGGLVIFKKYGGQNEQTPANEVEMQSLHSEQHKDNKSDQPAAPEN